MFGPDKAKMRLKAMEGMGEEPMPMKKKPPAPPEEGKEGYEAMMVTPEEKKMILEMRGEGEDGEEIEEPGGAGAEV